MITERVVERLRELVDAELGQDVVIDLEQVGVGLVGQLVALLDAAHAGGQDQAERQIRIAGRVGRAVLDAGGERVALLGDRHPDEAAAVVAGPADVDRRLEVGHEPLVAVDGLIGDRGDLARVAQQARHERLGGVAQVVVVGLVVERVLVAAEQRHVEVHARALEPLERFGHERRVDAVAGGDLADREPERHHRVGHREGVGVAQVDLLLARCVLVEAVLDRDAHGLERADRLLAQLARHVVHRVVEEAAVVERHRLLTGGQRLEVEVLDVGRDVEREPGLVRGLHVAAQHLARIAFERLAVEVVDVAEDPGLGGGGVGPREQFVGVGVGDREHVGFLDAAESVDRRTVEGQPVARARCRVRAARSPCS